MSSTLTVSRSAAETKLLQIAGSMLTNEQLGDLLCALFEHRLHYNFEVVDDELTQEDDRILCNMEIEE